MYTTLLIVFAIAMVWALVGEFYGREPIDGSSLVTYPVKLTFKKCWLTWVYRIVWAALIFTTSLEVIQIYLNYHDSWGWLLLIVPVAIFVLVVFSVVFVMLLLLLAALIANIGKDIDLD